MVPNDQEQLSSDTQDLQTEMQSGGVTGPDGAISHYQMLTSDDRDYGRAYIVFGSEERPGASAMWLHDLRRHLHFHYDIEKPEAGWKADFTDAEKAKLRPVAETLAMLSGNAFFGMAHDGREHYEGYLPEAHALYEANGGDEGWAGAASFAKSATPVSR